MIAIVDYGVGNLYSLMCSLRKIGVAAQLASDAQTLQGASKIILPGVGAFGDAAQKLREKKLDKAIQGLAQKDMPVMGICLGMQLLFDKSYEYGEHNGLGLIGGEIRPLQPLLLESVKIPHMGWNRLDICREDKLTQKLGKGSFVYYVHSYAATQCEEACVAVSEYGGVRIPGLVRKGRVCGAQFHPEKSGSVGLAILEAFARGADAV